MVCKKICAFCKCEFEVFDIHHPYQKYCSKLCQIKFYRLLHKDYLNTKRRELYHKNKLKITEWYYKNKDKILKQQIAYSTNRYKTDPKFHKKKNFRLLSRNYIPLKDKLCEVCGSNFDLHRHHLDYTNARNIRVLCRKCHNLTHNQIDDATCDRVENLTASAH